MLAAANLPVEPGAYALVMRCDSAGRVVVGRLGEMALQPGWYVYTGSALGPGGLAARLGRHMRPLVSTHWHIDYLRPVVHLAAVLYAVGGERRECDWARLAATLPGAQLPLRGFGSSDCACSAHLVFAPASPVPVLRELLAPHAPDVRCIVLSDQVTSA